MLDVDLETGEVPMTDSDVANLGGLEILERLGRIVARQRALESERDSHMRSLEAHYGPKLRALEAYRKHVECSGKSTLISWAKSNLSHGAKFASSPFGRVQFRKHTPRWVVSDRDVFEVFATENPLAKMVRPTIAEAVSLLDDPTTIGLSLTVPDDPELGDMSLQFGKETS